MKTSIAPAVCAALALLLLGRCGGEPSVASKSAAAYRDARAKGLPVAGGHEHGGHAASTAAEESGADDHSAMEGMEPGTADHAAMDHDMSAGTSMPMAHGSMVHDGGGHQSMADMQHGTASGHDLSGMSPGAMSGMQHGSTAGSHSMTGMQHGASTPANATAHTHGAPAAAPASGPASGPLAPDAFDRPSPVSVAEADKAAENVADPDGRAIVPGTDSENPPTSRATNAAPVDLPAPSHEQHAAPAGSARPQPADGHAQHRAAPTPEAVYVCPMHPEVRSAKPGTCPKCGMTLVRKTR